MTRKLYTTRPSLAEATTLPLAPHIIRDAVTSGLTEPYCVFMQDDDGEVSAMVYMTGARGDLALTRTYWPGHADHRWPPTRVATTPQQARWMLAERPEQLVALPESLVREMYRGWSFSLTSPTPE